MTNNKNNKTSRPFEERVTSLNFLINDIAAFFNLIL